MSVPEILNERIADQEVQQILRRERVNSIMSESISDKTIKSYDGRLYVIAAGAEVSIDDVRAKVKSLRDEADRLEKLIAEPVAQPLANPAPAPAAPQPPVAAAAPIAPPAPAAQVTPPLTPVTPIAPATIQPAPITGPIATPPLPQIS